MEQRWIWKQKINYFPILVYNFQEYFTTDGIELIYQTY